MDACIEQPLLPAGQREARTRWGTHESGAAFDRKKLSYLSGSAQQFLAQQAFCVIAGRGPCNELDGQLVMSKPGFVEVLDEQTCLLHLDSSMRSSPLLQRLQQATSSDLFDPLGLFFICHPARERLCLHGKAQLLSASPPLLYRFFKLHIPILVRLHIEEAFFHCSKYVRSRVPGLTSFETLSDHQKWQIQRLLVLKGSTTGLTEEMECFLAQQVLCFLCTVSQDGRCAVNHRGGAPGFLVPLPPTAASPGGTLLLPDYAGNGAFEALGNILETRLATLVVPNYTAQLALTLAGQARICELHELPDWLLSRCPGAQRVIALFIQRVEVQQGNWSPTLAYEYGRTGFFSLMSDPALACPL
jgi:uncharacterized protein